MLNDIKTTDPQIYAAIMAERDRENTTLELIASENFVSKSVLQAAGSVMTNKYAEGYPGKRYYGGCEAVDTAENLARDRVKELFGAEYANVQPHSGSQANMAVYFTLVKPGDTVLGMDLSHGGHLTHGSQVNFSGKLYNIVAYGVDAQSGRIDYDMVRDQAKKYKPKMIIAGGSAYPRHYDFKLFREIANEIGAFLMADVAHPAGLIAAGEHPNPLPYCHVVTSTTHKTLRGPRGGLVLMGKDFVNTFGLIAAKSGRVKMMSELLDSTVMPGIQGGPLMHVIAAKAVAFGEALQPSFKIYAKQVISNAKTLGSGLNAHGFKLISGGTDNHLLLMDLTDMNISGKKAEQTLEAAGMTTNKNMVPFDSRSPLVTSGIRIGTAALTTRGFKEEEMTLIADFIHEVISNPDSEQTLRSVRNKVADLVKKFPHYQDVE